MLFLLLLSLLPLVQRWRCSLWWSWSLLALRDPRGGEVARQEEETDREEIGGFEVAAA
jgi:hypothetical protein